MEKQVNKIEEEEKAFMKVRLFDIVDVFFLRKFVVVYVFFSHC